MLEQVKIGIYQLFDGDGDTRHKKNLYFLKMVGLPEYEGRANLIDYILIARFSARKGLVKSCYRCLFCEQMTQVASTGSPTPLSHEGKSARIRRGEEASLLLPI